MRNQIILQYFDHGIKLLVVAFLFLFSCGCSEPEEPEYTKHDWYAYYKVDGTENIITKDGFDNQFPIFLDAYEGYGYSILPDSSEKILYVGLVSEFADYTDSSVNPRAFNLKFVIRDKDILALKSQNEDVRLEKLTAFFKNKTFANIPGNRNIDDYITLTIIDKNENQYRSNVFNNGTYGVILDYVVKVEEVTTVISPSHGPVMKLLLNVESDLEDTIYSGEHSVIAKVQVYLLLPFSS